MMIKRLFVFSGLVLVLVFSGCGLFRPAPFAPIFAYYNGPTDWTSVKNELNDRAMPTDIETLQVQWKIKIKEPPRKGTQAFRANTLIAPPDRLRFRAHHTLAGGLFEFLVVEDQLWFYIKDQHVCYKGQVDELGKQAGLLSDLNPAELISLTLIEPTIRNGLSQRKFRSFTPSGHNNTRHLFLIEKKNNDLYQIYALQKENLLVEQITLYRRNGSKLERLPVHIEYLHYEEIEGRLMPQMLRFQNESTGAVISLEAQSSQINPTLHPTVFDMRLPRSVKIKPLEELWEQPPQ